MERRRYNRLFVSLPIHYQTRHPESGEINQGYGVTRDISLSGSYFHLDHEAPFQPGQILSITIGTTLPFLDIDHISFLKAPGEVIRLEPPGMANPCFGVAVNHLQNLSFASLSPAIILDKWPTYVQIMKDLQSPCSRIADHLPFPSLIVGSAKTA